MNRPHRQKGSALPLPRAPKGEAAPTNPDPAAAPAELLPLSQLTFLGKLTLAYWSLPILLILGFALYVLFVRSLSIYEFTLDDSFITYRYSKHLIEGHGLIWNLGEHPPVEGYTTFLWVLVNAVFLLLHIDPVEGSKLLSFAALLMLWPLLMFSPTFMQALDVLPKLPKRTFSLPEWLMVKPQALTFLPVLLTSTFAVGILWVAPETPAHVVSGMETLFSGLLLLLFALSLTYADFILHRASERSPHGGWAVAGALSVLALLCGLIRPEFNLGLGLAFVTAIILQEFWQKNRPLARVLSYALLIYVGLGLIYFLARYHFYGLPFPLPFYIKQLQPSDGWLKGLPTMMAFYQDYWLLLWLAFLGVLCSPLRLLPAFLLGGSILLYFLFPDHIMGIFLRFPYPVFPLLLWLMVNALHRLISVLAIPSPVWTIGLPLVFAALIVGENQAPINRAMQNRPGWNDLASANSLWLKNRAWLEDYRLSEHRSLIPFGKAIERARNEGQASMKIAMVDLGAVAYYGDWEMIDLFGLTHPKLALARAKGQYSADMLLDEKPDVVVLGEFYREPVYRGQFSFERELYLRMDAYHYLPAVRFIWNGQFGFLVFARNEAIKSRFADLLQKSPEIAESLQILPNVPLDQLPPHPFVQRSR